MSPQVQQQARGATAAGNKNKNANKNANKNKNNNNNNRNKNNKPSGPKVEVGYYCKAVWTEDGNTYDAIVDKTIGTNWVMVTFTAYGNQQRMKTADLIHYTAEEVAAFEQDMQAAAAAAPAAPAPTPAAAPKTKQAAPETPVDDFTAGFTAFSAAPNADTALALAETLKAAGISSLTTEKIDSIVAAINHKKKKNLNQAGLFFFGALCKTFGDVAEPVLIPVSPNVFAQVGVKANVEASDYCIAAFKELTLNKAACVSPLISAMLKGTDDTFLARVRVACFKYIMEVASLQNDEVGLCLPAMVPTLIASLGDSHEEVASAAHETFSQLCKTCIDNKDVEPFVPKLISCMAHPEETDDCIFELASTTFVQTVVAAPLAIVVPLLNRGFADKQQALKRQCAVITSNMSKLVEIPYEAQPFLPELLPALERCVETVSDPEARDVCSNALRQLQKIQKTIEQTGGRKNAAEVFDVAAEIDASLKEASPKTVAVKYVAAIFENCILGEIDALEFWVQLATPYLAPFMSTEEIAALVTPINEKCKIVSLDDENDDGDDAEQLCDCKFTLAYGSKILLHATRMKIKRGRKYGLLGPNDCGKTTLMRAIATGQLEDQGFPAADELKCIFVEADIQGEQSHLSCIEYIEADERITSAGITTDQIAKQLLSVGFSEKNAGSGTAGISDGVWTLSGGWRMKLALARAMLQQADILLMDEPTNHLDVLNVAWVQNYLLSLKGVTVIMVSTHTKTLEMCCQSILYVRDLKLEAHHMKISEFREQNPEVESFFSFKATKMTMKFPPPGELNGIKSKGRALMKMDKCTFTYPVNDKPTLHDITCRVSLGSRVACVGVNGAGKSTMIKLLTQELTPQIGVVWKHDNVRVAYVAQHAFHHIEKHLEKSANEYIRWRYQFGEDKEGLEKTDTKISDEEQEALKVEMKIPIKNEDTGKVTFLKRHFEEFTGARKVVDQKFLYEVSFAGLHPENNMWLMMEKVQESFPKAAKAIEKLCRAIDLRIAALEGQYRRALTRKNVEEHLADVGLAPEYSTHTRLQALSGGQKVKVALAAALWSQPHIIILDEPTNYLDRDSLGALAGAIDEFEGGVVIISHNEDFTHALCKETWVLEAGRLTTKGDAEWMKNVMNEKVVTKGVDTVVDGMGNVTKVKGQKKKLSRAEKKKKLRIRKLKIANGEPVSDDSDFDE
jgi:elongation factor 3